MEEKLALILQSEAVSALSHTQKNSFFCWCVCELVQYVFLFLFFGSIQLEPNSKFTLN